MVKLTVIKLFCLTTWGNKPKRLFIIRLIPFLKELPTDVVFDHMARPNVREGLNGKDFTLFQKVMESEKFWCKTTCAERLSLEGPETNYSDILPFMNLLINNFSDRVLWGTDWPHPNMRSHMPDDGILVDLLEIIAPKSEHQKKILVDKGRIYFFTICLYTFTKYYLQQQLSS